MAYKQTIDNEAIKTMKENGYQVFATKSSVRGSLSNVEGGWVFAVSPSGNVLYVQNDWFGGYTVSLQYVPSRKNGSGCRDNTFDVFGEITVDNLQKAERANVNFAHKLGAVLYSSAEAWKEKYHGELVEL
ncbi:MAG: hypothetical protein EOM59_13395 [Clostridia bacterium]|nr:hypothetical protein [Clostridia bacterium]